MPTESVRSRGVIPRPGNTRKINDYKFAFLSLWSVRLEPWIREIRDGQKTLVGTLALQKKSGVGRRYAGLGVVHRYTPACHDGVFFWGVWFGGVFTLAYVSEMIGNVEIIPHSFGLELMYVVCTLCLNCR